MAELSKTADEMAECCQPCLRNVESEEVLGDQANSLISKSFRTLEDISDF